jgi:GntR family transcriptional regulator / MocR family aminotransferase
VSLVIPLSKNGGPLYRQVYAGLREAILSGAFRAGDRFPSTRDLAEQLGISRTAVLAAYDQLLVEGFVAGRAGSGTYVAEGLSAGPPSRGADSARLRLTRFGKAAAAAAQLPVAAGGRPPALRYDFSYWRSSVEMFPFELWRRILLRHARRATLRSLDYGPAAGSLALREAICAHLQRSRAVVSDASQVIIVNGSQQALDLAARGLVERGDPVVLENPHYQGARSVFQAAGARLHAIPVDGDGLDPARLPARARIAYVTPSHQLPTGAILPLSRRLALLQWARRAGAVILEDDYDGEFRYHGQPLESMQGIDTEGRVVYLGTFSRTIFPALRIGYMIVPPSLVPAFTGAKLLSDRHTSTLEQETLAEFIATGAYERHLRRARRLHARRRETMLDAIARHLGDRVSVTGDASGTHLVIWPRTRVAESTLIAQAAARHVSVYGISSYFLGRAARPGLMLGYSRMKEPDIREGIRRLAEAIP